MQKSVKVNKDFEFPTPPIFVAWIVMLISGDLGHLFNNHFFFISYWTFFFLIWLYRYIRYRMERKS